MIKSTLSTYDEIEAYGKENNNEFENFSDIFNHIKTFEKNILHKV